MKDVGALVSVVNNLRHSWVGTLFVLGQPCFGQLGWVFFVNYLFYVNYAFVNLDCFFCQLFVLGQLDALVNLDGSLLSTILLVNFVRYALTLFEHLSSSFNQP